MGLILDSTVLIGAERKGLTVRRALVMEKVGPSEVGISVVTVVEFVHGIARADTVERRDGRQRFLDE
jgi:predicted nucleic acid-binding protein